MYLNLRVVVLCLLSIPSFADEITLSNGDRITGSIVKKDGKTLTVKSQILGTVTMPWDKVKSIRADAPVNIAFDDGETVQGTMTTRDDRLEIETNGTRRYATPAEISAIRNAAEQEAYERLLHPAWTELWAGTATLGWAGTAGNAQTRTFTTALSAARTTRTDKASIHFNAIRAAALIDRISAATARAIRGGWAYDHQAVNGLSINTFNDYEFDKFQNLDLRFVLGGGLSYMAWKGEGGSLSLLGGGAYNRESFSDSDEQPAFVRDSGEAYFGDDFTYKLTSVTSLYQNLRFFPNLTNRGEYRFNFDFGANTKIMQWLTWNLSVSDRFLSNPVPGRKTNDFLYTTGIGVTFAQ